MKKSNPKKDKKQPRIDGIDITSDNLSNRGGMVLFARYLEKSGILNFLIGYFAVLRFRKTGIRINSFLKQILCFFAEGTRRHLTYFDELKQDSGYSSIMETHPDQMASSHAIKRLVRKVSFLRTLSLRLALQRLFIHQLNVTQPKVVILGIDTMVMNNDDAKHREGSKPTYKKVKGFQPLQMYWNHRIIDAVFRGGDKHSNHSDTTEKMIAHMVKKIRKTYRKDVPIIIEMDSGFFDQKIFSLCESLHVGYNCGGKSYKDIKDYVRYLPDSKWSRYNSREKEYWEYAEFIDQRNTWKEERRAIYSRYVSEQSGQMVLDEARRDTIIYTNLGNDEVLTEQLRNANLLKLQEASEIVHSYHQRAIDELTNRSLKEFGSEILPFDRFESNTFWYYMMVLSFFVFQNFRDDIASVVVGENVYPNTLRRRLFDIAAKITCHSGKIVLKVTRQTWRQLEFSKLWHLIEIKPQVTI